MAHVCVRPSALRDLPVCPAAASRSRGLQRDNGTARAPELSVIEDTSSGADITSGTRATACIGAGGDVNTALFVTDGLAGPITE